MSYKELFNKHENYEASEHIAVSTFGRNTSQTEVLAILLEKSFRRIKALEDKISKIERDKSKLEKY